MRIGRAVSAGTLAMGAYRAYRQYKGRSAATPVKGRGRAQQQPPAGRLASMLGRR
ncbi:MAG: hypothetical protein JWM98_1663 [Thermoleophilia bacterium]|nr:hypothetical protein [Thermoleophilia bacterium]